MKTLLSTAFVALAFAFSAPAFAGGGGSGGGGGGGLSSPSGPSYDPTEEYQKGIEAIKAEDFKAAEKALKRVVKVAKKDANSHYLLGIAHYGQDEFKSAAKSFSKAVKYDPVNYDAHARLVISYVNTGKDEKAAEAEAVLMAAKEECAGTCEDAEKIESAIAMIAAKRISGADNASLPDVYQQASFEAGDIAYSSACLLYTSDAADD